MASKVIPCDSIFECGGHSVVPPPPFIYACLPEIQLLFQECCQHPSAQAKYENACKNQVRSVLRILQFFYICRLLTVILFLRICIK
jgi:hypothetical protein